ncbi:hypothetical protein MNO14_06840 [Luteimonas sp. S4-F44]|uniref:hypothetical protein n=1 Tax=Luteimonas sp. S4-F44 TaxID=2925842 RepID=UPI001F53D430|nr:hypothetical protein [Luteimonas sp. S4-F44]UNK43767.1 hypothetical protein MNO14_06840 [Luteimonas sp. S4-F44]
MNAQVSAQRPFDPPPPPVVDTLQGASRDTANATIAGMDAAAIDTLRSDVQALPASERQGLLNELATRLDAGNLTRLHDVFGQDAVASAVDMRAPADVREAYQATSGGTTPAALDPGPALPPMDIARIEAQQRQRAQDDFSAGGLDTGAISGPYQLSELAREHATEPAYLAELVRLADDADLLASVVAPLHGLYSRDSGGGYAFGGADGDAAREAMTHALGVAVERGVLSEGGIRHAAADSAGWADVAGRLGIDNVGRTQASSDAATKLESLGKDYDDAKKAVDKLDEELATHLLRAGPLDREQRAAFIDKFREAEGHAEVYAAEAEAGQALVNYVQANRETLMAAAVRDPQVAEQLVDSLGRLADSGHGKFALELLGEIQGTPGSALAEAFEAHTDTLQGELFERIASAATVEIVTRHDGNLQAALADLKDAFAPLKDAKGLFDGVKGGISSFKDGMAMMDAVAAGNFDPLKKLGDGFGDASPFARAMSGVGVVMGAIKAAESGQEGAYLEAVQGFASAGESGLNLLAGASKHFADAGRLAQYGDDAARFGAFAAKIAPGLGVIASATSMAINLQKTSDGGNVGYAVAAMGDVFGMLGSAVAVVPGPGTAAGAIVSGIGAVISAIGGGIGDAIDKHQTREELRGYLEATGMDADMIESMLGSGEAMNNVAAGLGISGEQWQAMLASDPALAYAPYVFKSVADGYGLQGDQAVELFKRMHAEDPQAMLALMREFGEKPQAGVDVGLLARQFLEQNFPDAHAYARSQETSATRPDGSSKTPAEIAEGDYAGIRSGKNSEIYGKAEDLLRANDNHDYRVRVLELLYADNRSDAVLELGIQYGVMPDELR